MTFKYIDQQQQLSELCNQLKSSQWLALDTEFIREKTYYAQLCLVQIATEQTIVCIDALAIKDLGPLYECLLDRNITKVLHAARQDLEIFHDHTQDVPTPVFDTQIGANLIGLGAQISYGAVVKSLLGTELDKSHARSDWSKRPLSDTLLKYAADDVRYLAKIYPLILNRMAELDREGWIEQEMAALCDPKTYIIELDSVWQRIKGANRLKRADLAVLRQLAIWREIRAQKSNKPRKWILSDGVLLELADKKPANHSQLEDIYKLPATVIKNSGDALIQAINQGSTENEDLWPQPKANLRPTNQQGLILDQAQSLVQQCATRMNISAAMIATRSELNRFIQGERDLQLFSGWRLDHVGKDILELQSNDNNDPQL